MHLQQRCGRGHRTHCHSPIAVLGYSSSETGRTSGSVLRKHVAQLYLRLLAKLVLSAMVETVAWASGSLRSCTLVVRLEKRRKSRYGSDYHLVDKEADPSRSFCIAHEVAQVEFILSWMMGDGEVQVLLRLLDGEDVEIEGPLTAQQRCHDHFSRLHCIVL